MLFNGRKESKFVEQLLKDELRSVGVRCAFKISILIEKLCSNTIRYIIPLLTRGRFLILRILLMMAFREDLFDLLGAPYTVHEGVVGT